MQRYIFWPFSPNVLSKLKHSEELKEGLEKRKGKGGKEEKMKSGKTHVKIPLWSLNDRKKSTKTGKNFRRGMETFFWLTRIYTPGRFA